MGQASLLLDRQGIHVGAHADHLARAVAAAADHADDPGPADPLDHLVDPEFAQFLGNDPRGAVHVEQQFRVFVDVAAPGRHFVVQIGDAVDNRHEASLGLVKC